MLVVCCLEFASRVAGVSLEFAIIWAYLGLNLVGELGWNLVVTWLECGGVCAEIGHMLVVF